MDTGPNSSRNATSRATRAEGRPPVPPVPPAPSGRSVVVHRRAAHLPITRMDPILEGSRNRAVRRRLRPIPARPPGRRRPSGEQQRRGRGIAAPRGRVARWMAADRTGSGGAAGHHPAVAPGRGRRFRTGAAARTHPGRGGAPAALDPRAVHAQQSGLRGQTRVAAGRADDAVVPVHPRGGDSRLRGSGGAAGNRAPGRAASDDRVGTVRPIGGRNPDRGVSGRSRSRVRHRGGARIRTPIGRGRRVRVSRGRHTASHWG